MGFLCCSIRREQNNYCEDGSQGTLLVIFDVLSISRKLKAWLKKSKVESLLQVLKVTKMDPGAPGPLDTDTVKWKVILFFAAKGSVRQLNILLALNEITQ
jgi:hypothetical protein